MGENLGLKGLRFENFISVCHCGEIDNGKHHLRVYTFLGSSEKQKRELYLMHHIMNVSLNFRTVGTSKRPLSVGHSCLLPKRSLECHL